MDILISIIIPVYNAERYLKETINSVLKQSYKNFEVIAIDDCSRDQSYQILKQFEKSDARIRVFKNGTNSGVSKTRNIGIEKAKGDWIAFCDSDDVWLEEKLEIEVQHINKNPGKVLFYTSCYYMNNDGILYSYILNAKENTDFHTILRRNIITCSSVVVKKDVIKKCLMCGDDKIEDFVSWLSITKQYGYAYGIDIPLVKYRIVPNSRSSSSIKNFIRMINSLRYIGFGFPKAFFYTLLYVQYSIDNKRKIFRQQEIDK